MTQEEKLNFKVGDTVRFINQKEEWAIDQIYIENGCVIICDKDKQNLSSSLLEVNAWWVNIEKIK